MDTVRIYKAQKSFRTQEIESFTIVIDEEVPDVKTLQTADAIYEAQAKGLCDALEASLPGGTFDRLLIEIMKRKVSHFKVSHVWEVKE